MDALLVGTLESPATVKIASMSGRVSPVQEVQYVAVKAREAGNSSGNTSQEFRSGREAIERRTVGSSPPFWLASLGGGS